MFESKEELKKIYTDSTYSFGFNDGIVEGIDKTWESFAKRVSFYKKYMYDWQSLFKEHENLLEIWFKSEEYTVFKEEIENSNGFLAEEWYQDWLFDYCFGDIK